MHIVSSCSVYSIILWCKLYVLWCIFYNIEMYIYCIYCDVYLDPVHTGLYMGEIFFLEYICGCVQTSCLHYSMDSSLSWILYIDQIITAYMRTLSIVTVSMSVLLVMKDGHQYYILLCGSDVGEGSEEIQYLKNVAGYGSSIKSRSHMS